MLYTAIASYLLSVTEVCLVTSALVSGILASEIFLLLHGYPTYCFGVKAFTIPLPFSFQAMVL